MQIAKLVAKLFADTSEFEKGFQNANRTARQFQKALISDMKLASAGVAAFGAALGALTIKQLEAVDRSAKLARGLGISHKSFQDLSLVADEAGVDQLAFANAIGKVQKAIIDAGQGSKEAQLAFNSLGLSFKQLINLSPDKQFEAIGEKIGEVKNSAERTAIAVQIFGKSGRDLIPMFEDLAAKVQETSAFNEKFGVSLSDIDVRQIEQANDSFGRIGKAINGLGNKLALEFAPIIQGVSDEITNSADGWESWRLAARSSIDNVALALDSLNQLFQSTVAGWKAAANVLGQTYATIFAQITGNDDLIPFINEEAISKNKSYLDKYMADTRDFQNFVAKSRNSSRSQAVGDNKKYGRMTDGGAEAAAGSFSKGTKDVYGDLLKDLDDESSKIALQIRLYGQKETAIDRATKMLEIENKLKKEGIEVGAKEKQAIAEHLTKLEEQKNALARLSQMNNIVTDTFTDIGKAMFEAGKAADKFKSIALNALSKVTDMIIRSAAEGAFGGSGGLGSLFSGIGSSIGGLFRGLLPSFAVGTNFVPHDMTANIHRGEMIIPAKEAAQMRAGGTGGVTVIQNITIGSSVTAAVRQEVSKLMPELKRASVEAVNDARMRGAT